MTFLEAKRALLQRRLARGCGGKAAGGKGSKKGLTMGKTRPAKGKTKGYGKRTGMGPRTRQAKDERDKRRKDQGMIKLSKAEIFARAKCHYCGERGHLARECRKGDKGGKAKASRQHRCSSAPCRRTTGVPYTWLSLCSTRGPLPLSRPLLRSLRPCLASSDLPCSRLAPRWSLCP